MAKLFTLWPVPGSFGTLCSLVAVPKFQDKFASLRQGNSSNSQDKFQKCCTDMDVFGRILSEFRGTGISHVFVNFAGFRGYT